MEKQSYPSIHLTLKLFVNHTIFGGIYNDNQSWY